MLRSKKPVMPRPTDFTPRRSKIHCIPMPYDGIDKEVETSDTDPYHVEASA